MDPNNDHHRMDIVSFDDWVGEGEDKHFNRFFGIGWLFENDGIMETV